MLENAIYDTLTDIFRDIFMNDNLIIEPEYSAKNVTGWDSFRHIEIIIAIEERYGIKFKTRELDNLQTVADLVTAISRKTQPNS